MAGRIWGAALAAAAIAATAAPAAHAQTGTLKAGVGKADITPKLGYYLGGWTRADRIAQGQHTRLHARALVLERGGRKVALVAVDLFMVPGGLVRHVGERAGRPGPLGAEPPDLRLAHALRPRRLRATSRR